MAAANDFERLHQRHTRTHHRCHLAAKNGDIFRHDFFLRITKERNRLFANFKGINALSA